jgi:hypothetical protein
MPRLEVVDHFAREGGAYVRAPDEVGLDPGLGRFGDSQRKLRNESTVTP